MGIKQAILLIAAMLSGCSVHPLQSQLDQLHDEFVPASDMELYGVPDYWVARNTGDCEDFALLAKQRLGIGEVLVVAGSDRRRHAVLHIGGGVAIDVMRPVPFSIADAGYTVVAAESDYEVFDAPAEKARQNWGASLMVAEK